MTEHVNRLSHGEVERLVVLAEECSEVIQMVNKTLRHGYDSYHPDHPEIGDNRERLSKEVGDLLAALDRLRTHDEIHYDVADAAYMKKSADTRYLHYQED